jgi:hypothetical protein
MTTHFDAAMAFIQGLIGFMGNVFEISLTRPVEELLNILMKIALIAFEA